MSSETTQFSAVLDGEHQYYRPRLPYLYNGQDNDTGYSAIWYGPDIVAVDQTNQNVLYNYATEVLTPTVSGNYTLTVDSAVGLVADGRSDTQIWLYDTTFDPERPLDNIIAANEDIDFRDENDQPVNWLSHLPNMPLIAGHTYVMVVTTYAADATGSANFSAIGPGELLLGELPPDPTAPVVESVGVPAPGAYSSGEHLDFTVTFDETVLVDTNSGTPALGLVIGGQTVQAVYAGGSGTATLTFRYTLVGGLEDADGIDVTDLALHGGTIRDIADNEADVTLQAVGDTTGVLVDTAAPSVVAVAVPAAGTYAQGGQLNFTVTLDEAVIVDTSGGTPRLALVIGSTTVYANYVSGSGTTALLFRHNLAVGRSDSDGITIGALSGNGGTLKDAAGNDAVLALQGVASTAGVLVDSVAPSVTGDISVPAAGSYRAGQTLTFTVTFDENVTVTGTDSTLGLTIGSTARSATFASKNQNSITYTYTVQAGENDTNGIAVGTLSAGTGTIRDAAGNDASLTLFRHVPSTASILVDTRAPAVTSVAVPQNGAHGTGTALDFTVTFDENMTVTGTDGTLELTIGGAARSAAFVSSTARTVTYRYVVQAGDNDADGIAVGAISTGTGAIRDAAGNHAALSLTGKVPPTAGIVVDTQAPVVAVVTVPQDGAHGVGTQLDFTVAFNENVTVAGTDGTLALTVGGAARNAAFLSSSGNTVTYRYTVQAGDHDADGIAVGAIGTGTGTIRDAAGNHATLSLAGHVPPTTGITVDTRAPAVSGLTVPADGTRAAGTVLDFTVAFDENVVVTGTDGTLGLNVGGTARNAAFLSSTGNTITYRYLVQAGDDDADGIEVGAIGTGTGAIRDAAGNHAALSLAGHVPPTGGITVDGRAPVVTGVTVPADGVYPDGTAFLFTVTFDEPVIVGDAGGGVGSFLQLTIGNVTRAAQFVSSSGNTITYRYYVSSDLDDDGITVDLLSAGSATIRDAAGNDAILSLAGHVPPTSGILVDTAMAQIISFTVPQDGTYVAGDALDFVIAFDEVLTVTDSASRLPLTIGGVVRYAAFVAHDVNKISYRYIVQAGDKDADGIEVGEVDFDPQTILDPAGNQVGLWVGGSVPSTAGIVVETQAPVVSSVTLPQNGTHGAGAQLDITIAFDENVTVTGTDGTLALTIGGAARSAAFLSSTGNTITYRYIVQAGDNDPDGIAIGAIDAGTGTIRDTAGNDAALSLDGHVPSTAGVLVDARAPAVSGVTVPQSGSHGVGAQLDFTVAFDENVTVTGTDGTLALTIGGSARNAAFLSSTGNTITYRYTVQAGDDDANGITIGVIDAGTGTVRDGAGNHATLSLAGHVPPTGGIVVDTQAPVVAGVTVPQGGSHGAGAQLDFTVTFDENVTVTGTDGSLALTVGGTARNAAFLSSTGNTVTYRYTVQAGDHDADGIAVGALGTGTGTIRDAAGNDATLSLTGRVPPTGGITVDTQAPVVNSVAVPANGTHAAGAVLDFTVSFDSAVVVVGTDGTLGLTIGGTARSAAFLSSTGNTVTYRYTVQAGDHDADGIAIGAIDAGTGTIRDAAGNHAMLSLAGLVPSTAGITVDTLAPVVTGVVLPQDDAHTAGAVLDFTVVFDDDVTVTGTDGALALDIGGTARNAAFLSSTGNTVTYRYTVQAGDNDADGIGIGTIGPGTGTIRDAAGNDAVLALAGQVPSTAGIVVDARAPVVTGVTVPQGGSHGTGDHLDFTVAFDENVSIAGTDGSLALDIGGTVRNAVFLSSTGNSVTYRYTVQAGDNDADGIAIGALALGASTIRDAAGNDAALALPGQLPPTGGILVDTQAPAVTGVTVPGNGVYGTGTQLVFTVAFGENVTVGGTGSTLDLAIGGTARSAQLLSSSGSTLTYGYTVQAGDGDADGIAVLGIALHGGTLRDAAGNDAALDLAGHLPPLGGVLVDTTVPPPVDTQAPSVAIVGVPADGTYAVGGQLEFTVRFDENVIVTGTGSTLGLMVGGTARAASFVSSSGNTVTYRYTVQAGDDDADGIAIGALALGASTIRDAAGNDASLALAGHLPPLDGVLVEGSVPDTVAPTFAGATVNRRKLVLTYDEAGPLDAAHGPATGAFTVMAGGTAIAVAAVTVDAAARTVTLTLATAVRHDQPVTVAYADPTGGNDAAAIQDAAGNDAAALAAVPVVNTTPPPIDPPPVDPPPVDPPPVDPPPVDPPPVDPPPVDPPPVDPPPVDPPPFDPPPADPMIDGVVVRTVVTTRGDGSVSQVVTIPVVTSTRVEQVGDRERADIALVKSAAGTSLLTAQVPLGFGLEASGVAQPTPVGAASTDLVREIRAHTANGSPDQAQLTRAGSGYIDSLDDAAALLVHTLVPTAARNAAPGTLVISGAPDAAGQAPTALVIDARALPPGSSIALHDVEFAVVVGPVRVVSGTGAQVVWSDSAAQDIMLGEGDDVLHGGGGNDIVGSGSGNDMVFGDAGNDMVFGGQGNDTVDGGSGNDTVQLAGAGRGEYAFRVVDGSLVATHRDGGADGADVIRGVETLRFAGADMSVAGTAARLVEALAGKQASVATLDAMVRMAEEGAGLSQVAHALHGQFGAAELDDASFVGQLYRNAFDRVPDSEGLAFWVGYLASGTARSDVALGIANSAEKLAMPAEVAFHATDVAVIVRLYDVLFDRAPDAAGLNHWIGAHEGGMSMMDIADAFMASSESMALHGAMSDAQFTGALYRNGLHREAADGEARYWLDALASGGADRGDVLLGFADAAEVIALAGTMSTTIAML